MRFNCPLILFVFQLWGILGLPASELAAASEDQLLVACSTTQVADLVRNVAGDRIKVVSILAPGQDPHLYEIKPNDTKLVSQAVLCFDNGWHLEGNDWMRLLAENAGKPIVSCTTGCKPLEIEEDGKTVHDPHAWFSPINAAIYVRNIRDALIRIDPDHQSGYQARAQFYLNQLRTLHAWTLKQVNQIPTSKRILVTSHDAFNYFCRDYGFKAATPIGWSTGQELGGGITPERRKNTIKSIQSYGVKAIYVETSVNPALIREIAKEANVKIGGELYSDSMGTAGSAGETYLGMMRENVITIVNSLK